MSETITGSGFNWKEIKQRLAQTADSIAAGEQLSPEQAQKVMNQRAALLARVPDPAQDTSQSTEVVTFQLGAERLAIETRFVREVVRPDKLTDLPGGPTFLLGLTNLRGEVLAVVDLSVFFQIDRDLSSGQKQVIVLGEQQAEFGVLADTFDEVFLLDHEKIHEPPASVTGVSREFLLGVTKDALLVLNGEALISDDRLYIDDTE